MTNKPMLSVERQVIEDILADAREPGHHYMAARKELRALLDKPEDKICSVCNGFGRYQDGDSGTDEDGRCPNIVDCDCGDSERIPEYRAKPAARNQGEPVAYTTAGMLEIAKRLPLTGRIGAKATKDERWNIPLFLGQAEQPAPVAVVMPERDALRDLIAGAIGGDTYDCTRVWSAWGVGTMSEDDFVPVVEQDERLYEIADSLLAEVAKLNGVKP